MSRPSRRASQKPSIIESDSNDENTNEENTNDDLVADSQGKRVQKMTYDQEDVLISLVLDSFDIIENKATDKSLNQSNKRRADEAWKIIETEYERQTKVSNTHFF